MDPEAVMLGVQFSVQTAVYVVPREAMRETMAQKGQERGGEDGALQAKQERYLELWQRRGFRCHQTVG